MTRQKRTFCADITGPQTEREESRCLHDSDCRLVMNHSDKLGKGSAAIRPVVARTLPELAASPCQAAVDEDDRRMKQRDPDGELQARVARDLRANAPVTEVARHPVGHHRRSYRDALVDCTDLQGVRPADVRLVIERQERARRARAVVLRQFAEVSTSLPIPPRVQAGTDGSSDSPSQQVPALCSRARGGVTFWRVPRGKHPQPIPRPTPATWTPTRGRRWLEFVASRVKQPGAPYEAVFGNSEAEMLYRFPEGYQPHPRVLERALSGARVWCGDMRERARARPPFRLAHATPSWMRLGRYLVVGENVVRDVATLERLAWHFRGHRPVMRAAREYLNGGEVDVALLQRSLRGVRFDAAPPQWFHERITPRVRRTGRPAHERLVVRLQSPLGQTVSALADDVADVIPVVDITTCARVGAFLLALSQQTNWLGVSAVVGQFALHFPEVLADQWRAFQLGCVMIRPQGPQPGPKHGFLSWDFARECLDENAAAMWGFATSALLVLLGEKILPEGWQTITGFSFRGFGSDVRRQCTKQAVKTVAESFVVALGQAASLLRSCVKARSLEPLVSGYSPVQWCEDVHSLVTYYPELVRPEGHPDDRRFRELLSRGMLPSGIRERLTPAEMRDYVDQLFNLGTAIQRSFRGTAVSHDIDGCLREVRRLQATNTVSHSVMSQRVQPLGVYLWGPPGSGKTNLTGEITRAIARRMGYPTGDSAIYKWQMNVNFQDGLDHTQWCVVFDDVDQNVAPAVGTTDNHYTSVLKVVNNSPLPVEQSDVTMKGKIAAKPLLALYCSNFEDGRLKSYSLAHNAFWRRLPVYAVVRAREGYEKAPGTGILDPDRVRADPAGNYLSITVKEFDPTSSNALIPFRVIAQGWSKQEFLSYLGERFVVHLEHQRQFLSAAHDSAYCPRCYADSVGGPCPCTIHEQAGLEEFVLHGALAVGSVFAARVLYARGGELARRAALVGQAATDMYQEVMTTMQEARAAVRELRSGYQFVREDAVRRYKTALRIAVPTMAAVALASTIIAVRSYLFAVKRYPQDGEEAPSGPVARHPPPINATVEGRENAWVRAPQTFTLGVPHLPPSTTGLPDIVAKVRASYVRVVVRRPDAPSMAVYGVSVAHNTVMTVFHIIPPEGAELIVRQQGIEHRVVVGPLSVVRIAHDTALVKVPGLAAIPSVFKQIWRLPETGVSSFDKAVLIYPDRLDETDHATLRRFGADGWRLETDLRTEDGTCGLMYATRTGLGWYLSAQHHAAIGNPMGIYGTHGIIVTQHDVEPGLHTLATHPAGTVVPRLQCSVHPQQGYEPFPRKSEFWAAVSLYGVEAVPFGCANPRVHGSTMKTRVEPTLVAEDFRHLEEQWCGERGYWRAPNFSGEMVDGKWSSPYIDSLTPLHRAPRQQEYYWLALADYVRVLGSLRRDGYAAISPEQAVIGVPGTVIHGVDMSTSVGMPFNRKKRDFLKVHDGAVLVDPRVLASHMEMRAILDGGDLPAPVALGMLKDEQLKPGKRPRVFNCLPFAYNWLLRAEFAGLTAFERANNRALECFVGVNMTSRECNDIVAHLLSRDPTGERLVDTDVSKQDKSEDGYVLEFVAYVDAAKAHALGMDPWRVYLLNHADRNTISVFKNDFFAMGAQNPSGGGRTVEKNSVVNSLQQRYMYYRMKYPQLSQSLRSQIHAYARTFLDHWGESAALDDVLSFRRDCALVTYGDDAVLAVSRGCSFYDPARIPELGVEIGMVFTDARKSAVFAWQSISTIQFLRRSFVWDVEADMYVARLSEKSLAKMLVLAKRSELTRRDHAAVLLTAVLREMVYYGRERYDSFRAEASAVADKHGLTANGYLDLPPFEVPRALVLAGTFSSWQLPGDPHVVLQAGKDEQLARPVMHHVVEALLVLSWVMYVSHILLVVLTRPTDAHLPPPGSGNVRLIVEGQSDKRFYRICGHLHDHFFSYMWESMMTPDGVVVTLRVPLLAAVLRGTLVAAQASAAAILAYQPLRLCLRGGRRRWAQGGRVVAVLLLTHGALLPSWYQIDFGSTIFFPHGTWQWWMDATYNWECTLEGVPSQVFRVEWTGPCLSTEA